MTHHPKERPDSLSRRNFLLKGAGVAVSLSAAGPCSPPAATRRTSPSPGAGGEFVGREACRSRGPTSP